MGGEWVGSDVGEEGQACYRREAIRNLTVPPVGGEALRPEPRAFPAPVSGVGGGQRSFTNGPPLAALTGFSLTMT